MGSFLNIIYVRYQAAHQAGFRAVEVAHPYNEDLETLVRVLKETGLKQVTIILSSSPSFQSAKLLIISHNNTILGSAEYRARHQFRSRGPGGRGGNVPGKYEDLTGLLRGAGGQVPAHHGR